MGNTIQPVSIVTVGGGTNPICCPLFPATNTSGHAAWPQNTFLGFWSPKPQGGLKDKASRKALGFLSKNMLAWLKTLFLTSGLEYAHVFSGTVLFWWPGRTYTKRKVTPLVLLRMSEEEPGSWGVLQPSPHSPPLGSLIWEPNKLLSFGVFVTRFCHYAAKLMPDRFTWWSFPDEDDNKIMKRTIYWNALCRHCIKHFIWII